ncbi:MAG: NADH:flavin oxidoreductase [Chloroflexi bacterium]|nr:NADH:flavin oxidoreductase [Chloroflexota bacterium]
MSGLLDPITVKGITLKNRIVMPPMANNMATPEGEVTEKHLRHYEARARAGVGFIMVEASYIVKEGRGSDAHLGIYDDKLIFGLRNLVDVVHQWGVPVGIQLNHFGSKAPQRITGCQAVGPSYVVAPGSQEQPRPMTEAEIQAAVAAFGTAARRAVAAGFDAVEVHGGHGYLVCSFLSPYTNRRPDLYGGDREGRLRFPLAVVAEVRRVVGPSFPLFYRLGVIDMVAGGLTVEESRHVAPRLVAAGVDVVDVTGGLEGSGRDFFKEQGFYVPAAHQIKQVVSVPVVGVGNIREPEFADRVIREGKVDLVAVGRAQLADPEWARQAARILGAS